MLSLFTVFFLDCFVLITVCCRCFLKISYRAGEMATLFLGSYRREGLSGSAKIVYQVKTLFVKPDELSSIPGTPT